MGATQSLFKRRVSSHFYYYDYLTPYSQNVICVGSKLGPCIGSF